MSEKFSALSSREKWLITLCGVIGIGFFILTLLIDPAVSEYKRHKRAVADEKNTLIRLESENTVINAKLKRDPDVALDKQLAQLESRSARLDEQLTEVVSSLISPSQMPSMLEEVLGKTNNLNLVSLTTLPVESIGQDDQVEGYYLHPVQIEVTGGYFGILSYLKALEAMPVRYYWRTFDYQVEEYPTAKLVMTVYTLGPAQEFIGG